MKNLNCNLNNCLEGHCNNNQCRKHINRNEINCEDCNKIAKTMRCNSCFNEYNIYPHADYYTKIDDFHSNPCNNCLSEMKCIGVNCSHIYNDATFIICDQCHKWGICFKCADITETPKEDWYCSLECKIIKETETKAQIQIYNETKKRRKTKQNDDIHQLTDEEEINIKNDLIKNSLIQDLLKLQNVREEILFKQQEHDSYLCSQPPEFFEQMTSILRNTLLNKRYDLIKQLHIANCTIEKLTSKLIELKDD